MHPLETLHVVNNGQRRGGNLISQYFISIRHEKITWSLDMIKGLLGGLAIPPVDTISLLWPAGESG